jgi:hypothetical protein
MNQPSMRSAFSLFLLLQTAFLSSANAHGPFLDEGQLARVYSDGSRQIVLSDNSEWFEIYFGFFPDATSETLKFPSHFQRELQRKVFDLSYGNYWKYPSRIRVFSTLNDEVVMEAPDCDSLTEAWLDIDSAMQDSGSGMYSEASCSCEEGVCRLAITPVLNPFIKRNVGRFRSSANCFNTSLFLSGVLSEIRQVDTPEMGNILSSKRCERRTGAPHPGDIVVIRRGAEPVHTFFWFN